MFFVVNNSAMKHFEMGGFDTSTNRNICKFFSEDSTIPIVISLFGSMAPESCSQYNRNEVPIPK